MCTACRKLAKLLVQEKNISHLTPHEVVTEKSDTPFNQNAKVLLKYGIETCNFITIHSATSSQSVVDTANFNKRTNRSIFNNIIPHTTGASKAIYAVLPELQGKVHGTSVRVPTSNVSMIDLNVRLKQDCDLATVLKHAGMMIIFGKSSSLSYS